jgi:plasmid stabilization system protein ParE
MATVRLSEGAVADLERIFEFIAEKDPGAALTAVQRIREAVGILARHPLIGRRVDGDRRELVISYGRSGYVALYRWFRLEDTVMVLAIRHQREAGYTQE